MRKVIGKAGLARVFLFLSPTYTAAAISVKRHSSGASQTRRISDNIDGMAFAVATCPKCSEKFRLIWRIGKRKLPLSTVIRLACPTCSHSFEQVAVELVVFDAGAEQFPKSATVDRSALVEG